jgi:hypothetical protein
MKKTLLIVAILFISVWGISELKAALSLHEVYVYTNPTCARATEECPEKPGHYLVVCKDGGAGFTCTYTCPYVLNSTDCE